MCIDESAVEGQEVAAAVDFDCGDLVRFDEIVETGFCAGEFGTGGELLEAEFRAEIGGAFGRSEGLPEGWRREG